MRLSDLVTRADQIIKKADDVLRTRRAARGDPNWILVNNEPFQGFRASALSFLEATFGRQHPYYQQFERSVATGGAVETEAGRGILGAAREELAGGWLQTTKGLVSAEIFADFLEMAAHLLDQDYKDPAAVIVGSVLEEHLRQLCDANDLPVAAEKGNDVVPMKADALNASLSKASVYNKLDHKSVTAWLDLRNKAAHGKYGEYTAEQVRVMLQGVTDFMARIAP